MVTHNKRSTNKICLTFDDVPYDRDSYLEIVNLLNRYGMKATFFVISDLIGNKGTSFHSNDEVNKDALAMMIKNGHQLANHGKTNSPHFLKSSDGIHQELDTCNSALKELYVKANVPFPKNKFYRPGCGFFNKTILDYCARNNYLVTLGSTYPNDPIISFSYLNFLYLKLHIEAGDVVILHDRSWTPATLRYLLPWLQQQGLTSVTLDDMFS